ncbi:hypothetical protein AWC38_SpisGene21688 [Stylophora pistillata]|uniref:Phospholipase A2-like domain-containing protein n=1 Tax=Stylophora pistillata TaxID=50429 RepID=A0A2B4R963_STYPI|nr:hypothetical protein AWC38_SpisGene21688 [Stylophora pistillata]
MENKLIVNLQEFQALVDFYKGKVSESTLLIRKYPDKAARVTAETQMLLSDAHTQAGLKEPTMKQLLMQERQLNDRLRKLPTGAGPETSEGGDQGNLLYSVKENLLKDLIRSVETVKEPVAVVEEAFATPSTSKKKKVKRRSFTPKKLFSTPRTSTPKPIKFPFTLRSLKDLPSTPILTGKRLKTSRAHRRVKAKAKGRGRARSKRRRQSGGKVDLQKWINKLGIEFHWPGYQYMGPGTKLAMRIKRVDPGINRLDKLAKQQDIDHSKAKNLADKHKADRKMITGIQRIGKNTMTERIVKRIMQAKRYTMRNFYLTIPSNDGSIKYISGNSNNSWKNRLNNRLDFEGDLEVGMSSISLPPESLLIPYLKGLQDTDLLMRSSREVQNNKRYQGYTHDHGVRFSQNPFRQRARVIFKYTPAEQFLGVNPGEKQLQWDAIYNEEEGTIEVTSEKVEESAFSSRLNFKLHCHFVLRKDMCDLFGWTKYKNYQSTIIAKHGPNLVMRKRDTAFLEDRTDS